MMKYSGVLSLILMFSFLYSGLNDNLISEAHNGDLKKVKFLIKKGADVNYADGLGNTSLHIACSEKNVKMVELLLSSKADPNVINAERESPLHKAAMNGNPEIVSLLLHTKADLFKKNKFGDTALILAVAKNFSEVAEVMIEYDKKIVTEKNDKGCEAVHFAAETGNIMIFKKLVESGADVEACDALGNTPLIIAAKNGHIDIADYILSVK